MPQPGPNAWAYGVLIALLAAAAVTDVRSGRIPNWLTYPVVAAGLIVHTLLGGLTGHSAPMGERTVHAMGLADALAGLAAGFLPMLAAYLAGGVGGGDAKLMAAVGALTGWRFTLEAMFWGFLAAALMAVLVMVRRKIVRRTLARLGRFLYLALTPTKPAAPVAADSPRIPFGLAMCLGAGATLIVNLVRGADLPSLLLRI